MKTGLLILICGFLFTSLTAANAAPPNVVFILADDLGWNDVSYHGGDIKTPNIDKLAASGAKLESFYVQPVCSPTRAALMTGRYPMRHGLQIGVVRPWATYGLPLNERILAQALREAGYETAICGKWHLGHFERSCLPTQRGFDHQYGHYNGALDYFTHDRDGDHDWHRDDHANYDKGYTTTLLGKEAVRLIEAHDASKPLFLYIPFNAPHSPFQALNEDLKLYDHITDQTRRTYAAMVHRLDVVLGEVVAAIEKQGMTANTLFIFSSDNGGHRQLGADNGNAGFHLVATGKDLVVPTPADGFRTIRLYKRDGTIRLMVDDLIEVGFDGDGKNYGPVLTHAGWIGLRQMAHTIRCEYDDLKVLPLKP